MTTEIIIGIIAFLVGGTIAFFIGRLTLQNKAKNILVEAENEAEMIKKDKILQAKEKFLQLKSEHEKVINEKNSRILVTENRLKQRESSLSQRIEEQNRKNKEVESIRGNLTRQLDLVTQRSEELEQSHKRIVEQLEAISGLYNNIAHCTLCMTFIYTIYVHTQYICIIFTQLLPSF